MSVLFFQTDEETLSADLIREQQAMRDGRYLRYANALARYGNQDLFDKAEADGWIACVAHDGFWRLP